MSIAEFNQKFKSLTNIEHMREQAAQNFNLGVPFGAGGDGLTRETSAMYIDTDLYIDGKIADKKMSNAS